MSAYREGAPSCPLCAHRMDEQTVLGATIHTCEACGGVFMQPGSAEIGDVATQARVPADPETTETATTGPCPRCARTLTPIVIRDASLLRCQECGGTFIPHAALGAAMWLHDADEAPEPGAIDGLRQWVRYLLER